MSKNKGTRILITLECSCRNSTNLSKRSLGICRYITSKNRRNTPDRLQLKKFCSTCNKHTVFKEIK